MFKTVALLAAIALSLSAQDSNIEAVRKMTREFAAIESKARKTKQRVRVYCEAWPNPRVSSPPWVAELVEICGGEMVVQPGKKVSEEQVAGAQPEVIVLAWAATGEKAQPEQAYKVEEWKDVPAIRNRQVHVISDELLNTPAPPLIQGAKRLFAIIARLRRWR